MKINGFKIQQDIREAQEERNLLTERFAPAIYRFPGEVSEDLKQVADKLFHLETRIADLQLSQVRFNTKVKVSIGGPGNEVPLMLAIKQLGGRDRMVNLWRVASRDDSRVNRRYGALTRQTDQIVAERTISVAAADELRREARKRSTTLRSAIQQGNSREIDAKEIDYPQ